MISIKGLRQGLLIVFSGPADEPWLTRLRELEGKLQANPGFFKGGTVAFDVKGMPLSDDDLRRSLVLLAEHDVKLWAVVTQDEATQARVRGLGLTDTLALETAEVSRVSGRVSASAGASTGSETEDKADTRVKGDKPDKRDKPDKQDKGTKIEAAESAHDTPQPEGTDGLLVRRRVRSGQVLRHPGHIVVLGDVNPGAQLLAGGDIIVWGKLQGSAHAGALGDDHAVICALEMSPSLVKIADAALALRPDERRRRNRQSKAETAQLIDQQITFTSWT